MAKQIEDIIPSNKKSIRDIPIPESRRKNLNLIDNKFETPTRPAPEPVQDFSRNENFERPSFNRVSQPLTEDHYSEPVIPTPSAPLPRVEVPMHRDFSPLSTKRKLPRKPILIGGVIGIIILSLGAFSLVNGATVTYTPKSQSLNFNNDTFTAKKNGGPDELLFSVIKLADEKSTEAPASGEEQVSVKASGVIVVYNNSSVNAQRLIKTTRFETPDGKVYRIANDISVPGQKVVGGKTVPGSLEVTVYADQPGDSYNIGLSDFTLPGLKGDPKFTTIYARSKTPMSGGMVGTVKKVSDEDKVTAKKTIEGDLKESLMAEAGAQVPADFILLPNLVQISYEPLAAGTSTGDKAVVRERGNFSGIIFKKTDLVKYLASKKTSISANDKLDADLSTLNLNFIQAPQGDLAQETSITFSASGDTIVVWISDEGALATALAGKSKGDLKTVLNNYPSIVEADAVVRPFWKRSFPDEVSKIKFIKSIK